MAKRFSLLFLSMLLISCSSVRIIKPLNKGEKRFFVDLGGPLIKFSGIPIVIPLSSIGGAYGINDKLSLNSGIHTTSLLFGTFQSEINVNIKISEFNKTGLSINAGGYNFLGFREKIFSFYPLIDLNYYWNYHQKSRYFYTSLTNIFELHKTKAFNEPIKERIIPTFSIGHRWEKDKCEWGIELKYINFIKDNRNIVVKYIAPVHYGTLGLTFSFSKKF